MSKRQDTTDRRRFLNLCAGAMAASVAARELRAADLPHLSPTDPNAQALGYVEDAATVDAKKFPQHEPSQNCANCNQFTKQPGSAYGACVIFAGKAVSERGWCGGYVLQI
jgi:flagellar basal body rod protein FlgC